MEPPAIHTDILSTAQTQIPDAHERGWVLTQMDVKGDLIVSLRD